MCVGLVTMRVTELWMPPRVPVISDPGVFTIFSCAWYIMTMPGLTALAHHRARRDGAVGVEELDPVVVDDAGFIARHPR